jgi:hypothetical protein
MSRLVLDHLDDPTKDTGSRTYDIQLCPLILPRIRYMASWRSHTLVFADAGVDAPDTTELQGR